MSLPAGIEDGDREGVSDVQMGLPAPRLFAVNLLVHLLPEAVLESAHVASVVQVCHAIPCEAIQHEDGQRLTWIMIVSCACSACGRICSQ